MTHAITWTLPLTWELCVAIALSIAALALWIWIVRRPAQPIGFALKLAAILALCASACDPRLITETRESLPDIAVVVVDQSGSQSVSDRQTQAAQALQTLQERLGRVTGVDTRVVFSPSTAPASDGTRLFETVTQALTDIAPERLGAIFMISDGIVHDIPNDLGARWQVPIHVLLTGHPHEADRRIEVLDQPDFALVGQNATVKFRVIADGEPATALPVTVSVDGEPLVDGRMAPNRVLSVDIPIRHSGQTVVDLAVAPGPGELSVANNHRIIGLSGVRDRLKVLLLSGAPHVGERVWRSLLKSDPGVDLVHFTILRSPNNEDPTPLTELSLINFPVRELFEDKLPDFDLVVLDRYRGRSLPASYLNRLADYVAQGGALLVAAGPEFADPDANLAQTRLGEILPTASGPPLAAAFRPTLTETGRRHPVTAPFAPLQDHWGRWLRLDQAEVKGGTVLLETPEHRPVLMVNRVGAGRVGVFLSDSVWLWARGWDGGGPHRDLLRRLAHWLMKEPDLEEEKLSAEIAGGHLSVTRQSLGPVPPAITVTAPDGNTASLSLTDHGDGTQTGRIDATQPGLWQVADGQSRALAVDGDPSPLEGAELVATPAHLQPVTNATRGWLGWITQDGVPEIGRATALDRPSGRNWAAVVERNASLRTGLERSSPWPGLILLTLSAIFAVFGWWRDAK